MKRDPAATYDLLDRKQPHRLNFLHVARVVPGMAGLFTGRVPDQFIAQVGEDVVEVLCVCKPDQPPRCPLLVNVPCECGRWFLYTGEDVRVARVAVDDES